jgi:tetratricopeptide (TPR) repeat protein
VDASTLSSIKTDLQVWSRALGDGHERDVWEDAVRVLSSVPQDERSALILDNADDPTLNLVPFLPENIHLTVIITSRNHNLGSLSTTYHMELGAMELDEALTALLHAARRQLPLPADELQSAQTLLKELGCLAVALVQAGTYCHELSCSFTKYLSLFYFHRAELMKRDGPSSLDNYERGAYTTLDLSYKALPQDSRDFLHFISFFHHADIPLSALAAAAKEDFNDGFQYLPRPDAREGVITDLKKLLCVDGGWSEMRVQDTLRTLRSFSLLSITSLGDNIFLHLHPLIQAWARDMNQSIPHPHRAMALQVLTACCGVDSFQLHRSLLPHIIDIPEQLKGQDIHINNFTAAGRIIREQGHYQAAAELLETALGIISNTPDNDEKNVATISESLATVYWSQGRLREAEKVCMEVLEKRQRILGVEHPHTIMAASSLAMTYRDQGRWGEAEKLQVDILEQSRRILGVDHPDTILVAANLAVMYGDQGRYSEAEKMEVELLEERRRRLGMEHPDTITAASNLAATYRYQGRWSETEKLQIEALGQRRRILGMEHRDTILAASNLAATYWGQGRWSEAEKLQVDVLEQWGMILGMEHPNTITAAANLAATYRDQGRWSEAEKLQNEALGQSKRILGMEHPDTILAASNLALTYHYQGRWSEAEKLQVDVLDQRRRAVGMEHPDTILAASNLALTYQDQGRWSEAEKLQVDVLDQRRRAVGMEHPDTIGAALNLALTYQDQGRWSEAEKLQIDVLEQRRKILGVEHLDTIKAAAYLAATYGEQGHWEESAALLAPAVQLSVKVHGRQHPDTQRDIQSLAFVYEELGKEEEAQEMRKLLIS